MIEFLVEPLVICKTSLSKFQISKSRFRLFFYNLIGYIHSVDHTRCARIKDWKATKWRPVNRTLHNRKLSSVGATCKIKSISLYKRYCFINLALCLGRNFPYNSPALELSNPPTLRLSDSLTLKQPKPHKIILSRNQYLSFKYELKVNIMLHKLGLCYIKVLLLPHWKTRVIR